MAKCLKCGKKGLFLKLNQYGMCKECAATVATHLPTVAPTREISTKKTGFPKIKLNPQPLKPAYIELMNKLEGKICNAKLPKTTYAIDLNITNAIKYLEKEKFISKVQKLQALKYFKVNELKEVLSSASLSKAGNKDDLIQRIAENLRNEDITHETLYWSITDLGQDKITDYNNIKEYNQHQVLDYWLEHIDGGKESIEASIKAYYEYEKTNLFHYDVTFSQYNVEQKASEYYVFLNSPIKLPRKILIKFLFIHINIPDSGDYLKKIACLLMETHEFHESFLLVEELESYLYFLRTASYNEDIKSCYDKFLQLRNLDYEKLKEHNLSYFEVTDETIYLLEAYEILDASQHVKKALQYLCNQMEYENNMPETQLW